MNTSIVRLNWVPVKPTRFQNGSNGMEIKTSDASGDWYSSSLNGTVTPLALRKNSLYQPEGSRCTGSGMLTFSRAIVASNCPELMSTVTDRAPSIDADRVLSWKHRSV